MKNANMRVVGLVALFLGLGLIVLGTWLGVAYTSRHHSVSINADEGKTGYEYLAPAGATSVVLYPEHGSPKSILDYKDATSHWCQQYFIQKKGKYLPSAAATCQTWPTP